MRADTSKIVRVPDMHKVDPRFLTSASITKLRDKAAKAIAEYNAAIESCPHPKNEQVTSYCNMAPRQYCGVCGL